jgi:hypothetical protein
VNVYPAKAFPHQRVLFQEAHGLIMIGLKSGWKRPQQGKYFLAVPEKAARQLSDHETVAGDLGLEQQR